MKPSLVPFAPSLSFLAGGGAACEPTLPAAPRTALRDACSMPAGLPVPALAAWTTAYLALVGVAQMTWLDFAGAESTLARAACCVPALAAAVLAFLPRTPAYRARLLAAGALLPPALWGACLSVPLPPVVVALHQLLCVASHAAACGLAAWHPIARSVAAAR